MIASLPEAERAAILAGLTDKEAESLLYDWYFWARESQRTPPGPWVVWLILTGRGFGKTRTGSEWVRQRVEQGYGRIALVAETAADARDVLVEGESGILAVSPPWNRPEYEPSKRRLTWPNGAIATTYSGDDPDQLRGPQHDSALVDELCKYRYPEDVFDNLEFGLRLSENPQAVVTTTPRPIPIIKKLLADPGAVITRGSLYENEANLPPVFLQRVRDRYEGTRLGRQEIGGEVLEDNPGALWKRQEMIEGHRKHETPKLVRIVVGVDPPASSTGAEAGIVVAARGSDNHLYILDDCSLHGSPDQWGKAAVAAYNKWGADRIIGEVNNGGDMVGSTIRTVDKNVSYKAVRATRGKATRAEPISALYEQGRAHHVGAFPLLEDQMVQWEPSAADSPDRLDALVWAATELMLGSQGWSRGPTR